MGICTHWFYTLLFPTKCWCTHLQDCVVYDEIYMYLWPGWNIPVRAGLSRTLCCRTDLGQGTVWLDEIPTLVGVHHFPTLSISPLSTSEKTVSCSHTTAYWALNNRYSQQTFIPIFNILHVSLPHTYGMMCCKFWLVTCDQEDRIHWCSVTGGHFFTRHPLVLARRGLCWQKLSDRITQPFSVLLRQDTSLVLTPLPHVLEHWKFA